MLSDRSCKSGGAAAGDGRACLDLAARLAIRAMGDVEPNPMVGAVIVNGGRIIGMGHHRKFGGLHAEREALADCRRRGEDPRGATMYVTLEPCCHHGKQPPCTDAVIEAGIARVIAARPDPNPLSGGGAAVLRRAGIAVDFDPSSRLAAAASGPFIKGLACGMPWVIAKWAQTADGRLITRPDEPRWISGEQARRRVHRIRARVDAVLTGIGTALADDPRLTARGVRVHRAAARIVIDPRLDLPLDSSLVRTAREVPVVLFCSADERVGAGDRRGPLERAGVRIMVAAGVANEVSLTDALGQMRRELGVSTVLLECGPRLLNRMFAEELVDVAVVHAAGGPGDPRSARAMAMRVAPELGERFMFCRERSLGPDLELVYSRVSDARTSESAAPSP